MKNAVSLAAVHTHTHTHTHTSNFIKKVAVLSNTFCVPTNIKPRL